MIRTWNNPYRTPLKEIDRIASIGGSGGLRGIISRCDRRGWSQVNLLLQLPESPKIVNWIHRVCKRDGEIDNVNTTRVQ